MELNPNHEVTRRARDHWHKIVVLMLIKLGKTRMDFTMQDVLRLEEGNRNIVLDARDDGFEVRIVGDKEAEEIAKKAGGRACDS